SAPSAALIAISSSLDGSLGVSQIMRLLNRKPPPPSRTIYRQFESRSPNLGSYVLFYQRLVQGFCRMDVPPSGMDFLTRFLAPCCDIHIASTRELRPNQGLGPFAYARRYE